MQESRGIVVQAWACLVAMTVLLCLVGPQTSLSAEQPIKVGTTASLSGIYAAPGNQQLRGIKMWADDINARGALLGRKVELIYYDDQSDLDTTLRLYERLINQDKVDLLIGPYSSELTLVASGVAEAHDFPMVAANAAARDIWSRGYKNIFQVDAPAGEYMNLFIEFAKEKKLNRIAVIYADADFTREVAQGVRERAAKYRMEIVFDEEYPLDYTETDIKREIDAWVEEQATQEDTGSVTEQEPPSKGTEFSGLVSRMLRTNPEIVIGGTYLNDSVAFMREAKKQRLLPKAFAFTVGPALPEFGDALGAAADGVLGAVPWMRSGRVPMAMDFSFRFERKYGRNAGGHAAFGYGAGQVLEAGVRLAGSLAKDDIRRQLSQMKFRSLLGFYRVDAAGEQIAKSTYVMQWQNGRRRLVLPEDLKASEIVYPFTPWSER